MNTEDSVIDEALARALGDELRRVRETRGWSRAHFVPKLRSPVRDRTLLAYEHGLRKLAILRFLDLCQALKESPADLLARALQRAELHLSHLKLRVDLNKVLTDRNMKYRPLVQWARNRLNHTHNGIIEVSPDTILELSAVVGHTQEELTRYLCTCTPDPGPGEVAARPEGNTNCPALRKATPPGASRTQPSTFRKRGRTSQRPRMQGRRSDKRDGCRSGVRADGGPTVLDGDRAHGPPGSQRRRQGGNCWHQRSRFHIRDTARPTGIMSMTTCEPTNPLLARRRVQATVRRMRKRAALGLGEAASLLDLSSSALSRMETGDTPITVHLARSMMDLYDQYSPTLIANVRAARTRGWWRELHFSADHYVGWESGASGIREVAITRIPDLLQTEDYARALLVDGSSAERELTALKIRQDRLTSSPSLRLSVVLDESALHKEVGGPHVMGAQLEHLRTTRPAVSIRVLPANTGALFTVSNFRLLEFDHRDDQPIVFADTPMELLKEERHDKVALAQRLFEDISNAALPL